MSPAGDVTLSPDANLGVTLERRNVPGTSSSSYIYRTHGRLFNNLKDEEERDENHKHNQ
jgi:hypothetical protein